MHSTHNINIKAIVSCLPQLIEDNASLPFDKRELKKVISSSGIQQRRIADKNTTVSDLGYNAAIDAINNANIDKNSIGVLVFVTQYPDYILPSTAHILQDRLQLPQNCLVIQLNEGCAGYVYGMHVCMSLLSSSTADHGLLIVGDTTSKVIDNQDQGTRPLFGDGASATIIAKHSTSILTSIGGDGAGSEDIIVNHGGFRNQENVKPKLKMKGMNVFAFGMSKVPKIINAFLEETQTDNEDIDYIVLHQANKMMNERIIKKINFTSDKAIYSLQNYGNTSSASIPITITTNLKNKINKSVNLLACGFGVGLAWGTMTFVLDPSCYLNTIIYNNKS
ncbi:MAG: ketoacyl-ACP synthase III [Saprospiraceae bacterium]